MEEGRDSDRRFCWEQIGKANRAFRISRVFASRDQAERLLPLYAVFSSIEQICSSISDEGVAHSKLNWWRMECLHNDVTKSRHPVIRELHRSGARVSPDGLARLFDDAESRLDGVAPPDLDALFDLCAQLQQPQFELELGASGFQAGPKVPEARWLAPAGLLQLIRESAGDKGQGGYWWIPLGLLARHGVRREQIGSEPGSAAVRGVLADVFSEVERWRREGSRARVPAVSDASTRHLCAINGLYARKLGRLAGIGADCYEGELQKLGVADLLAAWKGARQT